MNNDLIRSVPIKTAADPWDVLQAAFQSGDRERLRRAIEEADSPEVQNRLSPIARAELNGLISEAHKYLFMDGFA
ncbi:hypothetical protein [Deinococcus sp.]|uniref:hypothetical protein n=1 Tax=Deinococcus sp. TaxID=47478 RepID=UPI003C79CC2D